MELITLCGLFIVSVGFWAEFELAVKSVNKLIANSKFFHNIIAKPDSRKPAFVRRMPVCLAKPYQY